MRNRVVVGVVVVSLLAMSPQAFALDKRLKLAFKLAGYGAAAGLVIGAGTWALGMGGFRNVLMGTSSGLYAGLAFAGYLMVTPPEDQWGKSHQGPRNPYAPRKPVAPEDDYDQDEDGLEENLRPEPQSYYRESGPGTRDLALRMTGGLGGSGVTLAARPQAAVWAPLVSLSW